MTQPLEDMKLRQRIFRNTASNYIGQFIVLGVGFVIAPFILHTLGASVYGLWVLVNSVMAYGSLLDLGLYSAVVKYVSEYYAKHDLQQAESMIATALSIYTVVGLIAIMLSIPMAFLFPRLFSVPPVERSTITWLVILAGVNLGLSIPGVTIWAVLNGLQRFDLANILTVTGTLINALATVAILLAGGGVLGVICVNLLTNVTMQIPAILLIRRTAPGLHVGWHSGSRKHLRQVASFSASLLVTNIAGRLQNKTDEIVIGASLPITSVTPYYFARRLSEVVQTLTDQFMKVLLPLASELHATEYYERLRKLYLASTRLTLVVFLPLGCIVVILGQQILSAWVGAEYGKYAYLILILTVSGVIDTSQWPAGALLQGMVRHQPLAVIAISSGIINLGLSILLVQHLGVTGVALGTLIPTTIANLVFVAPYAMRTLGVNLGTVVREVLRPVLIPMLPTVIILFALRQIVQPSSLPVIALVAAAGLSVYVSIYYLAGADSVERQAYQNVALATVRSIHAYLQSIGSA